MFKFLKDKIGKALDKISSAIQGKETQANADTITPESQEKPATARAISKKDWLAMPKKAVPKQQISEESAGTSTSKEKPEPVAIKPKVKPPVVEKPGFFSRLLGTKETSPDLPNPILPPKPELSNPEIAPANPESDSIPSEEKATPALIDAPITSPATSPIPAATKAPQPLDSQEATPGFFSRVKQAITTTRLTDAEFETLFWDLEVAMLENNVALEAVEHVKGSLRTSLVNAPLRRGHVAEELSSTLAGAVKGLFSAAPIDIVSAVKASQKPFVIAVFGVNGSGKTTTIAKLTRLFQNNGLSVVMAASDTFRAAAIDQLQLHADALKVRLVRHDYGSDAAAVAFDAVRHAQAHGKDVVLIDTAGRLHTNTNLMDELRKVVRVAKPQLKLFVGEAITGNDCIEQAKQFNEMVGIDGIVLSKADIDEKGGASVSVSYVTGKPIVLLGTGQGYDDLQVFSPDAIVKQLGLV